MPDFNQHGQPITEFDIEKKSGIPVASLDMTPVNAVAILCMMIDGLLDTADVPIDLQEHYRSTLTDCLSVMGVSDEDYSEGIEVLASIDAKVNEMSSEFWPHNN